MHMKYLLPAFLLMAWSFAGCKKNQEEEEEQQWIWEDQVIVYDGNEYVIKKGAAWNYQLNRYPSHQTFAYFLLNGKSFDSQGEYTLEAGDPPISLFYYLSAPATARPFGGDFEFLDIGDEWVNGLPEKYGDKRVFTFAVVGFDANNNRKIEKSELIKVTGGTINSFGGEEMYDLKLENGKTIKGRVSAVLDEQLPPA